MKTLLSWSLGLGVALSFGAPADMNTDQARRVQGVVLDPDGKAAVNAQVTVFPDGGSRWTKTGRNGAFSVTYSLQPWQLDSGGDPCLVVRDTPRHLAASVDLSEDTTNLTVTLERALTLTGRVEGPNGAPLANAQVGLWLLACRSYSTVDDAPVTTDAQGSFEIRNLPAGREYIVFASAKGYGRGQEDVELESETNQVELPTFVLNVADKILAGQVLDPNKKPAAGVHLSISGEGQPQSSTTTDSKGRFSFKVCAGEVRLFASMASSYANMTAEAGDTNVVLQLDRSGSPLPKPPTRAPLIGNPLPDLAPLGLAAENAPADKPLLLCLVDVEQRPSRRAARLLADRHDELRQKGLAVAAVQAVAAADDRWKEWANSTPMPFPVGRVAEKSPGTAWATSVTSLPWLILRDAQGKVTAEGFPLEELDAKLDALKKR